MSHTPTIIEGAQIVSRVTFRNLAGEVADPAGVTFAIRAASAPSETTYVYDTDAEVTRSSEGVYVAAVPVPTAEVWYYEWWALDADSQPIVKLARSVKVTASQVT